MKIQSSCAVRMRFFLFYTDLGLSRSFAAAEPYIQGVPLCRSLREQITLKRGVYQEKNYFYSLLFEVGCCTDSASKADSGIAECVPNDKVASRIMHDAIRYLQAARGFVIMPAV